MCLQPALIFFCQTPKTKLVLLRHKLTHKANFGNEIYKKVKRNQR